MNELTVKVRHRKQEADGICSFELVTLDGSPLPDFTAGAHIDVHVAPSLVRQYSLCGAPGERELWRIAVQKESQSRGGSAGMHEAVVGGTLRVSPPRNHFELAPEADRSLLIAGGIGITPIIAMAQALHVQGADFDLHYCANAESRMAFREEIASAPYAKRARFHVTGGDAAKRLDVAQTIGAPRTGTHLYVCGPAGFMEHVLSTARSLGWPDAQLHREHFAGVVASSAHDATFDVVLAKTGRCLPVPPEKTVLQVLLDAGCDVAYSCESGVCGTCLTGVLEGVPDHRDSYLTDAERAAGDQFTPCCSRARSPRLVLDL